MSKKSCNTELGQTAVLFAVVIIALVVIVALAIDGGSVLNGRRVVQNAADSGALAGVHHMVSAIDPTETSLLQVINGVTEANGVPDTDGLPGNEVNDNVIAYYTNDDGVRLSDQNPVCDLVGTCGAIPDEADGLEVDVDNQVATFFLGVISRNFLDVGAGATAVVRIGETNNFGVEDNVLIAFGDCPQDDKPLDASASNVDFIGGVYGRYFENRGEKNHYHGQVTYDQGYIDTAAPPNEATYEPDPPGGPIPRPAITDPFASLELTYDRFHCTTGDIGSLVDSCFDLTVYAPAYGNRVTTQMLKQKPPGNPYMYQDGGEWKLREGLYYAGPYPFYNVGETGLSGTVTMVSHSYIKITEDNLQLTAYMDSDTVIPGLLLFSDLVPPPGMECWNHEELLQEHEPINTTGNSGNPQPGVYHADDKEGCVNLDDPSECYELGGLQYIGILYAPYGRLSTSGDGATYVGAVVAYTIRVNGYRNRSEGGPGKPDKVGALFVYDSNLFRTTTRHIILEN